MEIEMDSNRLDVITLCDYEMCPTIKCDNEPYSMIVVRWDGESQSVDSRVGYRFEPHENRAIGDARS
jgi:hypothetical protein